LFAPGDNIWTTQKDLTNPYGSWRGTSFSSPIVAAVAALGFSLNPSLSNYQITDILKQTADPFQTAGLLVEVRRINALHAMTAIAPQVVVSSPLRSQPPSPVNADVSAAGRQ
jgi:subtilisin family serine protease